jgi:ribosome modulation factor
VTETFISTRDINSLPYLFNQERLLMKRQKRDKLTRAHSKGYQAGIVGRSKEYCPFQASTARSHWLGGWREAFTNRQLGLSTR